MSATTERIAELLGKLELEMEALQTSLREERDKNATLCWEAICWLPIKTAPRDGTNVILRFGSDGASQGKYVPGLPRPWKFIDTNDGVTWLVNHAVDGPGGPTHWLPMPR